MDDKIPVKMEIIKNKKNRKNLNNINFMIQKVVKTILIFISIVFLFEQTLFKKNLDNKEILNKSSENTFILNQYNKKDLSEKIKFLKQMTNNDVNEYKGIKNCLEGDPDRLHCIYHLLNTKEVFGKKRILLGHKSDGCYVLLDDLKNIKIAYSFGIGRRIQFDLELAKRGIDVYMYDHTIKSLPFTNEKFHWKKIGIAGKKTNNIKMKTQTINKYI